MKKKILLLLLVTIITRLGILFFVKTDVLFFLSPRNFNGRGLLTMPGVLDFILPLLAIALLYGKETFSGFSLKNLGRASVIFLVILTVALTGLILRRYSEELFFLRDFSAHALLRWLLFVLTFWAIQLFADNVAIKNRFLRKLTIFVYIFFLAFLQDTVGKAGSMYVVFSLMNSVGVTTALLAVASRNLYKKYPAETLVIAALAGLFVNFFLFNAQSISYFTVFLPILALYLTAFGLYCNCRKTAKTIIVSTPVIIALLLNFALPPMLSKAAVNELTEQNISKKLFEEKVGTVTVKYADKKLRSISVRLAKVINAANRISQKTFGISPDVDQLTILGIAPGGFHGKFPHQIVGNIISEKYLKNCSDSLLLNTPDLPADFPDPVNAILHEYSHLFGAIPYYRWMPGAEEEGWATFSATRLSGLLFKEYGKNLWQPGYDYAGQAKKITALNLSGRAVVWSHPNEFGGFKLWYDLDRDLGTKELYQKRWKHTYRNLLGSVLLESNPRKARNLAAAFETRRFIKDGYSRTVRFGDIYSLDDYLVLSDLAGVKEETIRNLYAMMKNTMIDPSVPVP